VRLDRAIRAKQKIIGLLHEHKQGIIHRAVTRGLDPSVPLKPSGISWLGDIPKHWAISRIKAVLREADLRSEDGSGTLLSLTRARGLITHAEMTDKVHSARTLVGYKQYRPGQLVMNRMQAWSGMFGVGITNGLVSPDYAVFDVLGGNEVTFILHRLKAPDLVGQFVVESKGIGSGFNRLYTDRFGSIPISLPPPDEQVAIVRSLDKESSRFNPTINLLEQEINHLSEYRNRLVADVVTGKLDVREAAARLPDEVLLATVEDTADLSEDLDGADEEAAV
jgi:type I restriction enzyme S subunit